MKQENILNTAGISEVLEISKIIPYGNNAKIHTKEQIEEIKKSIQKMVIIKKLQLMKKISF